MGTLRARLRSDPWPHDAKELVALQRLLASARPEPWVPPDPLPTVGASYVCFERGVEGPGEAGDRGWAGAGSKRRGTRTVTAVAEGRAGAAYRPGLLALREGSLRAAAVERLIERLEEPPAVVIVDATGRDHPRGAGLALHLGAVFDVPTVGATHRPLSAEGDHPGEGYGQTSPLVLDGEPVGAWVRSRAGVRPLVVHAGWRTSPEVAVEVVLSATTRFRTPQVLREARHDARVARSEAEGRVG